MEDHRPSPTTITLHQERSLPPLPSPPTSFALHHRPRLQRRHTPAPASLELSPRSTTTRLPSSSSTMSPPPPKTPTARLHRRAHPSPPPTPSYYGEEDIFFTPPSSRDDSMPPTPTSPTFSIPRSTSPHASFVKKFSNKWKSTARDELDFGCAGDAWSSAAGPADLGDRYYSTQQGGNRASTSSSVMVPSLTHSRAHSSSSDFSTSTMDSSLPPSPTPSSCASLSSSQHGSSLPPLTPLPYTSRVPLTPRTAQRKRQSDEILAVDALNHFFTSVRLSQIAEDVSPASTARASFSSTYRGSGSPPTAADILLSKNHAPPPPPSSNHGFEIEFIDSGCSTYTPLPSATSSYSSLSPSPSSSHSSFSHRRNTPSPIPDSDVAGALEELSEYFTSPLPSPRSEKKQPTLLPSPTLIKRPSLGRRPTRSGAAGVRIGFEAPSPSEERRVSYGWI